VNYEYKNQWITATPTCPQDHCQSLMKLCKEDGWYCDNCEGHDLKKCPDCGSKWHREGVLSGRRWLICTNDDCDREAWIMEDEVTK